MEVSQEVVDFIVENKDESDEDLLGMLIGQGFVSFSKARPTLNYVLVDQGLRMTKEQKEEKVKELMDAFPVSVETTADEVAEQIELIMGELDVSKGVARNYVKSAFVEADIDMPKAKATGIKRERKAGFSGDAALTLNYFIENPNCNYEDFKAYMESKDAAVTAKGADKTKNWYAFIKDIRIFITDWKKAGNCDLEDISEQ